jgi:hypothetical protein
MKLTKRPYWIFTALFLSFMLVTSVTQVISAKGTIEIMTVLQMPMYMLPLLGVCTVIIIHF